MQLQETRCRALHRLQFQPHPHLLPLTVLRLRQPQQHFSFTTHTLSMFDEPRLAMAFTTSLRHTTTTSHPLPGGDGAAPTTQQQTYLDSAALQVSNPNPSPSPSPSPSPTSTFSTTTAPTPNLAARVARRRTIWGRARHSLPWASDITHAAHLHLLDGRPVAPPHRSPPPGTDLNPNQALTLSDMLLALALALTPNPNPNPAPNPDPKPNPTQAVALSDMVIAVQSEPTAWQSHLMCMAAPYSGN